MYPLLLVDGLGNALLVLLVVLYLLAEQSTHGPGRCVCLQVYEVLFLAHRVIVHWLAA